ncbi:MULTISPECIES: NADPH-dependent FMN reductase [unclassified Chryseobacterium]|uniref:NADPH-dependent FMN reductase n=1 Tax=unclassified Chryseobacterium TaxID=2593645 RepID=UPI000E0A5AC1|nr:MULTISPECIES: NADPH-dependent FMN reductase [unclassified Chryseobacterium]MDQ1855499.1 NADPH-dependent FMN reductase [Chryseobacterium sp. WLY505]
MPPGKKILVIIGSASANSSNQKLMEQVLENMDNTDCQMYTDLAFLPHFDTALTDNHTPEEVLKIREDIKNASGVIFSTPEYIFSIPGRVKNLLEWCVSTTVFSEKPVAVITASASGERGHEELLLILKTLGAVTDDKHQALIKGIKGKFDGNGLLESNTFAKVLKLVTDFTSSVS